MSFPALVLDAVFFNDTATTEIYTLSLHVALPIFDCLAGLVNRRTKIVAFNHVSNALGTINPVREIAALAHSVGAVAVCEDRKSTRLNSSHANISYAVFCLKKK